MLYLLPLLRLFGPSVWSHRYLPHRVRRHSEATCDEFDGVRGGPLLDLALVLQPAPWALLSTNRSQERNFRACLRQLRSLHRSSTLRHLERVYAGF